MMRKTRKGNNFLLLDGDCIQRMKQMGDNSVDSIVTDPPYELGFMGKKWDSSGIAYNTAVWRECLRVLKHGGHLLAFGGTRTYHRMVCAIEDAGFEIRDMIEWIYGSGFPKSLNISKEIDKKAGAEREVIGSTTSGKILRSNGDNERPYQDGKDRFVCEITKASTEEAKEWDGWGTALKPAHEPIVVARKPLVEKNITENVLKHRTGGINIDGCRIETDDDLAKNYNSVRKSDDEMGERVGKFGFRQGKDSVAEATASTTKGRFPANLILDKEAGALLDQQSGNSKSSDTKRNRNTIGSFGMPNDSTSEYSDEGGASRFFYCPKPSRTERDLGCSGFDNKKFTAGNYSQSPVCKTCDKTLNGLNDHSNCSGDVYYREMKSENIGNNHPTVKPIRLMQYLVRLVTPPKGLVLDPFTGSGSTGCACVLEDFHFVGIDMTPEYLDISEARISYFEKYGFEVVDVETEPDDSFFDEL